MPFDDLNKWGSSLHEKVTRHTKGQWWITASDVPVSRELSTVLIHFLNEEAPVSCGNNVTLNYTYLLLCYFAEQWSTCWQLGVSRLEMTQQLKRNEYNSIIWPTSSAHVAFVQKGQKMCSWLIERTKVMTTMLSSMLRTFRKPMQIDTQTEHENRSLPTLWHMHRTLK